MKKIFALIIAIFASGAIAAEAVKPAKNAKAAQPEAKSEAAPLITLTTVEKAFARTLNNRDQLVRYIVAENQKLAKATDAEKKQITENVTKARASLNLIIRSMDIIFGIDANRVYEYNPTNGTIYLKVGTVNETFTRALQRRTILANRIVAIQNALKNEKDEAKKAALQRNLQANTQAFNQLVDALFVVYQIHPKRQYRVDASNGTIYLISTPEEVAKIQKQLEEIKKKSAEAPKK